MPLRTAKCRQTVEVGDVGKSLSDLAHVTVAKQENTDLLNSKEGMWCGYNTENCSKKDVY